VIQLLADAFWMALSHPRALEPPIALNARYSDGERAQGQDNFIFLCAAQNE
jgi:hypothetical protein